MKSISEEKEDLLNLEYLNSILEYNKTTGVFIWKARKGYKSTFVGKEAGSIRSTGYRYISINSKKYAAHRLAWFYMYNRWPNGVLDHINRDKADNRIENLRESNQSLNNINKTLRKDNTTGFKGVYPSGNKYKAQARYLGTTYNLGTFDTAEEASSAYITKLKELGISSYYETTIYS